MSDTEIEKVQEPEPEPESNALDINQLMDEMMSFTDEDLAHINEFTKLIAYKGFDPVELVETMRKLQPDEKALAKDLSILIVQFLTVGRKSGNQRFPKKKKRDIIELQRLNKLYGISKKASSPEVATLRRIAIAFAPTTVRILMKNEIERPVTNTELLSITGESLPWCIRTQIYLSTLPTFDSLAEARHKVLFKIAVQATVSYCYLELKVTSREGRENSWTGKDYMADVIKYAVIALKAEHLSEKDKSDVWAETLPYLNEGQSSMERLVEAVKTEVPEFDAMFESECGSFIS